MASGGFNFGAAPSTINATAFNFASQPQVTANPGQLTATGWQATSQSTPSVGSAAASSEADEGSKFAHLHKTKSSKSRSEESQRKRASDWLDKQKQDRYDYLNHVRKMADCFVEEEEEEEDPQKDWLKVQSQLGDPNAKKILDGIAERQKKKEDRKFEMWRFRNQLMHSEWLLEKPEDFEEKYVMVPIPEGRRNLVIASGGQTACYSKNGQLMGRFPSHLPGGGKHKHKWNMETAIIDCIFNEVTKTYYILDMMCWRQTPMYDTETQFRFYWMHEKYLEVTELATISNNNQYRFEPLQNFKCLPDNIFNVLSCSMSLPMDGVLFYHKEAHYTFGFTPLVLWLRPHMVPEALGIMVPQKFIDRAPPDYKGFEKFKEQCLRNMEFRDNADQAKLQKKAQKKHEKSIEKLKAQGKDYSHLLKNFVPSGNLSTMADSNSGDPSGSSQSGSTAAMET